MKKIRSGQLDHARSYLLNNYGRQHQLFFEFLTECGGELTSALHTRRQDVGNYLECGVLILNKHSVRSKKTRQMINPKLATILGELFIRSEGCEYLFSAHLFGANRARNKETPLTRQAIFSWFSKINSDYSRYNKNATPLSSQMLLDSDLGIGGYVKNLNQIKEMFSSVASEELLRAISDEVSKHSLHVDDSTDRLTLIKEAREYLRKIENYVDTSDVSQVLGYTSSEFVQHIESQFEQGMTWGNRSEWHVDHVVPVSWCVENGIVDMSLINALSNLKPLWAIDNLRKSNK